MIKPNQPNQPGRPNQPSGRLRLLLRRAKEEGWLLILLLTALLCAALAVKLLLRWRMPAILLPELDAPNIALLSLSALSIDHYAPPAKPTKPAAARRRLSLLLAPLCFLLLPWAAGEGVAVASLSNQATAMAEPAGALRLALLGGAIFAALTLAFDSLQSRPAFEAMPRLAPAVNALCLFCAAQILAGLL